MKVTAGNTPCPCIQLWADLAVQIDEAIAKLAAKRGKIYTAEMTLVSRIAAANLLKNDSNMDPIQRKKGTTRDVDVKQELKVMTDENKKRKRKLHSNIDKNI